MSIIGALFNYSTLIESDAEVILDRGVSLVGELDLATAECVDLLVLKSIHQALSGLIESCCLDKSALFIDQIDVDELSLTFGILPIAQIAFFD